MEMQCKDQGLRTLLTPCTHLQVGDAAGLDALALKLAANLSD
jgi:hypothetical protein